MGILALAAWGASGVGTGGGEGRGAAISSSPADGEPLPVAPTTVSLTFAGEIDPGPGGITVTDEAGRRVDLGVTTRPAPNQLRIGLAPNLPDGTYRADYRVLNPTGDVLTGHIAFGVGAPPDPAVVDRLSDDGDLRTGAVVGAWSVLAMTALLLGTLLAVGVAVFAVVVAPPGTAQRPLVPWVRWSVLAGVLGAVGVVVGRAAEATGDGLSAVASPGVLGSVLRQGGTGWWLVGLVVGLAVVYLAIGLASGPVRQALAVYGALVAAGSFALAGHAAAGSSVVAGVGDAVHVAVAAVWLGGVVGLWLLTVGDNPATPDATRRFTPLGTGALVLLWITGAVVALEIAGSPAALLTSAWGAVLVVKLAVVVAVTVVVVWGGRTAAAAPARLRRTLATEAVLIVAVVALSAALVTTLPEPDTDAAPQPTSQTLPVDDGVDVNLLVTPGTTGLNDLHITYLDEAGLLTDRIESVTVEMTLPFEGIGPIVINGPELEPGHFLVVTENLTTAGVWRIDVVSRIGTTEQRRTTFEVPIAD